MVRKVWWYLLIHDTSLMQLLEGNCWPINFESADQLFLTPQKQNLHRNLIFHSLLHKLLANIHFGLLHPVSRLPILSWHATDSIHHFNRAWTYGGDTISHVTLITSATMYQQSAETCVRRVKWDGKRNRNTNTCYTNTGPPCKRRLNTPPPTTTGGSSAWTMKVIPDRMRKRAGMTL